MQGGDTAINPRPAYNFEKTVQGSFHKENEWFGNTASIQCACNLLYALCCTQIKQIFQWGRTDLHHILVKGDSLCKSLHIFEMLSAEEIPASVKMCGHNIPVNYVKLETKSATLTSGGSF